MLELPNTVLIAVTEAQNHIEGMTGDVETVLRAAMKVTSDHWLVTDDEQRLRAALAATVGHFGVNSPEAHRIKEEVRLVSALSAGDFTALSELAEFDAIGIVRLWQESITPQAVTHF